MSINNIIFTASTNSVNYWEFDHDLIERMLISLLDLFFQVIDRYDRENNKAVGLVCIAFQKPFDKLSHERLVTKSKFTAFLKPVDAARSMNL